MEVIVDDDVLDQLFNAGLPVEFVLGLVAALNDDIPANIEQHRRNRDQEDPDLFFVYKISDVIGDRWHSFTFWINDTTAEGYLFVEEVFHEQSLPLI